MKIDAFAHVITDRYRKRVLDHLRTRGDVVAEHYEHVLERDRTLADLDARFALMDAIGPDYRQVLVMAHTSVEHEEPAIAAEFAKLGNEEMAALVRQYPERFAGWVAQATLQDGARGLEALDEALLEHGAVGVQTFTQVQGRPLDHPEFESFFEHMAKLGRPIWIHPNRTAKWADYPDSESESRYMLFGRAGWPADTTVTMMRLVYAGYLERWPELKFVMHHSGGTVPMLAGRLKQTPDGIGAERVNQLLTQPVDQYLKRFYVDTANFGNPIALRAALEFFGVDHVLFGTDFGFSAAFAPDTIADIELVVQDNADKRAVYEDNTRRLLGLPA